MRFRNHFILMSFFLLGFISMQGEIGFDSNEDISSIHCHDHSHTHSDINNLDQSHKDACHDDCQDSGCKCPHHHNVQHHTIASGIYVLESFHAISTELIDRSFYYQLKKINPIYLSIFTPPNI
jgi:hypothetical protein